MEVRIFNRSMMTFVFHGEEIHPHQSHVFNVSPEEHAALLLKTGVCVSWNSPDSGITQIESAGASRKKSGQSRKSGGEIADQQAFDAQVEDAERAKQKRSTPDHE